MSDVSPKRRLRLGYFVFSALAGIKIAEYSISQIVRIGDWPYLAILAMFSAWLLIYYFKHIHQLWRSGGKDNG